MADKDSGHTDPWAAFVQQHSVQPLKTRQRVVPQMQRKRFTKNRAPDRFLFESPPASSEAPFAQETTEQGRIWWQRSSLRPQEIDKLKKGRFSTPWKIDLHGMTVEEAEPVLKQFLLEAWQLGARYALIIHGKGYNSEGGTSILRQLTHQLLPTLPFVLAFSSAQPKDGDTGATYVFLKAH